MPTAEPRPSTPTPFALPAARVPAPGDATDPTRCVTCGASIGAHYCAECGERRADERPRTLAELLGEAWEAVVSVDGRLLRSLRVVLTRPGALTVAHLRGERVRWVGPLRLFLVANLVYFAVAGALHFHAFTTPLGTHVAPGMTLHTPVARRLVAQRMLERRVPYHVYRDVFDAAYATRSRSLLVLLVPMIAAGAAAVGHRRRPYAAQHVVFALHMAAAILLYQVVENVALDAPLRALLTRMGRADDWRVLDTFGAVTSAAVIGTYAAFALRRVYEFGVRGATLGALALVIVWFTAIQLYRTALFFITFWTT